MDKMLYGIAALAAAAGALFIVMGLWSLGQPFARQSGVVFLNVTIGVSALIGAAMFAAIGRIIELLEVIAIHASARTTSTDGAAAAVDPAELAARERARKLRNESPLRGLFGKG